jgi:hypothetical protein
MTSTSPPPPDISYYLIFSFLSLSDLTNVVRCNKKWKRIVQSHYFPYMFHHNKKFLLKNKKTLFDACLSPFNRVIHHIKKTSSCALDDINLLHHFPRLTSLDIEENWCVETNLNHIKIFKVLNKRLKNLKIHFITYRKPNALLLDSFHTDLAELTNLTSLSLLNCNELFVNFSFLLTMKSLNSLKICGDFKRSQQYVLNLMDAVRSLPCLTYFCMIDYEITCIKMTRNAIARLCNQPGAPSKLKQIRACFDIGHYEQDECEKFFSQLPALEIIECVTLKIETPIPTALRRWLQVLHFCHGGRILNSSEIDKIISFPHLVELYIWNCRLPLLVNSDEQERTNLLLEKLIYGVSNTLQTLNIGYLTNQQNQLTFELLSSCKNLKSISFSCLTDANFQPNQFEILQKCTQLETIILNDCKFYMENVSYNIRKAFRIPSIVFPHLKTVQIDEYKRKRNYDQLYE